MLGGTAWVGREVAAQAASAGHEVVCVARGESGQPAEGARLLRADRDRPDALEPVAGESWDAVRRRLPPARSRAPRGRGAGGRARTSCSCRRPTCTRTRPPPTRTSRRRSASRSASDAMASMEEYGAAKVACEQAVQDVYGERCTIARAGLIGGPGDWSDRTGYWPSRFAAPSNPAGEVLAPDVRDLPTSVIDARDLAAWLLLCATERVGGAYNACGPVVPLEEHVAAARCGRRPHGRGRVGRPGLAARARRARVDGSALPAAVAARRLAGARVAAGGQGLRRRAGAAAAGGDAGGRRRPGGGRTRSGPGARDSPTTRSATCWSRSG